MAENITPELDQLSCELIADALDLLAAGKDVNVMVVTQDEKGSADARTFADDGPEECLTAARDFVSGSGAQRYAIAYDGAVADESGSFFDALLVEFGERGGSAFSAYVAYEGRGEGDDFAWADPEPAGETDLLLS